MLINDEICAIIVTYNPGKEVVFNVKELYRQIKTIVIVDNGSISISKKYIEQIGDLYKCKIIYNGENLGIATALNIGVKYAIKNGYKWVATFDQDSTVTQNMIKVMENVYKAFPEKETLAIISPKHIQKKLFKEDIMLSIKNSSRYHIQIPVMASGNIIRIDIFKDVGFFNDDLFIDYVDYEFCFRCKIKGYLILEADDAILKHHSGNLKTHLFMGKKFTVANYSYIRRYYISRNKIYIYKKYGKFFPKFMLLHALDSIKEIVGIIFFEKNKAKKFIYIIKGINDGVKNKFGKML